MKNRNSDNTAKADSTYSLTRDVLPQKMRMWAYLSAIIFTIAILVTAGWLFNIQFLKQPIPGLSVIGLPTALSLIFCCISYWFLIATKKVIQETGNVALKESDNQIQTIFNAAPDAVIVIDEAGKIIRWNSKAETLFGWQQSEVVGKELSETIIPDRFREVHKKGLRHFLNTGEGPLIGKVIETCGLTKNGAEIDIALNIAASPKIKGGYLFIGFIRNITQRIEAAEKLKRVEQQYRLMIDEVEDYAILLLDNEGIVRNWNKGAEKIKGYTAEEIVGKNFRLFYTKEDQLLKLPEDLLAHATQNRKAIDEGWRVRKDGNTFWASVVITALHDEEGKVIGFTKVTRDITARKNAEEKFRSLLDAAPDATVIVNKSGVIQMINQQTENLFGYSRDEIIGQPVEVLIPQELGDTHVQHRKGFFKEAKVRAMGAGIELNAVKKNKTKFPVEISLSPIQTEEGILVSAAVRDISDRKKLENELRKSNEEMEAFTYSVSHDLRAPLRGIIGFTTILEEDYSSQLDDEAKRITSVIKSNTMKMGHLIDDLLAFSRMGKNEVIKKYINSDEMVKEVIAELVQQYKGTAITWEVEPLPDVNADMNTIRQVWINLISNAIKYSRNKEKSGIKIGAYISDEQPVFFVKDNGVGFDEKYRHKLFKVFQRLHSADEFEGTGVGLALVEKIVSKHGGKVWAEAKVNQGATFYFSLPSN